MSSRSGKAESHRSVWGFLGANGDVQTRIVLNVIFCLDSIQ